jgi:predicted hotdog family 3-hydroxylacyl-ACP dehydratase
MAQACGLLLGVTSKTPHRSIGVVASVRGYEYAPVELDANQNLLVRAKPEALEGGIAICEAELYSDEYRSLLQKARITLAIQEQLT